MPDGSVIRVRADQVALHLEVVLAWADEHPDVLEGEAAKFWREALPLVTEAKARTYLAPLATGLVARSMFDNADATALRADSGPGGYSAPTVWRAFYEFAGQHRLDIRGLGPAPLNNNPFLNKSHVRDGWPGVRDVTALTWLAGLLDRANQMTKEEARQALAVLIHERREVADAPRDLAQRRDDAASSDFWRLATAAARFASDDSEGGRRGQALVAACLSLMYDRVESEKVNDPSRRHPGDVRGYRGSLLACYAEAKQKSVTGIEVRRFVRLVAQAGCPLSVYVALADAGKGSDLAREGDEEAAALGVLSVVYVDGWLLARDCAAWSTQPLSTVTARFDAAFLSWLEALAVAPESITAWTAIRDSLLT
jgi:hypothetical protein